jgi:hypothetical protein
MQALAPNSDFMSHMGDTFKHVALPALALGAGTGAVSGYLSSGAKPGETSQSRRHRILRNALIGAALGSTAGVTLPMGYEALNTPLHTNTASPVEGTVDSAIGFAGRHALPLGVGTAGYGFLRHNLSANRNEALTALSRTMGQADKNFYPAGREPAVANLANTPGGAATIARKFQQGNATDPKMEGAGAGDLPSVFQANELMQEAGHKGMDLAEMQSLFGNKTREKFLEHVGNSGILGQGLARLAQKGSLPFADQISKIPGLSGAATYDPARLAEMYSRTVRPSVGNVTKRWMSEPSKWSLLAGSVLAANEIQKRLTGQ